MPSVFIAGTASPSVLTSLPMYAVSVVNALEARIVALRLQIAVRNRMKSSLGVAASTAINRVKACYGRAAIGRAQRMLE